MITFPVKTGAAFTHNALFTGTSDTRLRQTPMEHRQLLDIKSLPGYAAAMAIPNPAIRRVRLQQLRAQAIEREKRYSKYWNEKTPRRDSRTGIKPLSSSSWIGQVTYGNGVARVRIGNRNYSCPMTERTLKQFLESPSLGRFFNKHLRLKR